MTSNLLKVFLFVLSLIEVLLGGNYEALRYLCTEYFSILGFTNAKNDQITLLMIYSTENGISPSLTTLFC